MDCSHGCCGKKSIQVDGEHSNGWERNNNVINTNSQNEPYENIDTIGDGSFRPVFIVQDKNNGRYYAKKMIDLKKSNITKSLRYKIIKENLESKKNSINLIYSIIIIISVITKA